MSTVLPTINDMHNFGDVANRRKEVTTSQKERTNLTLEFNCLLADFAKKHNYIFIDLTLQIARCFNYVLLNSISAFFINGKERILTEHFLLFYDRLSAFFFADHYQVYHRFYCFIHILYTYMLQLRMNGLFAGK